MKHKPTSFTCFISILHSRVLFLFFIHVFYFYSLVLLYQVRFHAGCWVLGAGCWVLGAGCWVLGAGCWVLGAGCWVLGAGCWVLGAGCWVLGAGCWVLGAGCWVLGAEVCTNRNLVRGGNSGLPPVYEKSSVEVNSMCVIWVL